MWDTAVRFSHYSRGRTTHLASAHAARAWPCGLHIVAQSWCSFFSTHCHLSRCTIGLRRGRKRTSWYWAIWEAHSARQPSVLLILSCVIMHRLPTWSYCVVGEVHDRNVDRSIMLDNQLLRLPLILLSHGAIPIYASLTLWQKRYFSPVISTISLLSITLYVLPS